MIKFVKGLSRRLVLVYLPPFVSTKLGCWLGRWFVSYPMTGVTTQDEAGRCLYLGAGSDIHRYIPLDGEAKNFLIPGDRIAIRTKQQWGISFLEWHIIHYSMGRLFFSGHDLFSMIPLG